MEDKQLAEYLRRYHLGEHLAVTSQELEHTLSVRGKELRDAVNRLRRRGVPIASSSSGYFYAATEQEVRATIAHMTNRISGIAAAIRGLNKSLDKFDPAQLHIVIQDSAQSPAQTGLWEREGARQRSDLSPSGRNEQSGLCGGEEEDGL